MEICRYLRKAVVSIMLIYLINSINLFMTEKENKNSIKQEIKENKNLCNSNRLFTE